MCVCVCNYLPVKAWDNPPNAKSDESTPFPAESGPVRRDAGGYDSRVELPGSATLVLIFHCYRGPFCQRAACSSNLPYKNKVLVKRDGPSTRSVITKNDLRRAIRLASVLGIAPPPRRNLSSGGKGHTILLSLRGRLIQWPTAWGHLAGPRRRTRNPLVCPPHHIYLRVQDPTTISSAVFREEGE